MTKTRNNHYVPQWYQEGFFEPGSNTLAYLDLSPPTTTLPDGRVITQKAKFDAPTSRAFRELDLYSTFFGTSVNDEIERRLFGDIDTRGSKAIRAFTQTDINEWIRHFQTLFEYIDIQKIRTPKGLDWLRAQYPFLTQNELMMEMQGIRMMHCTIWTQGVREIVSAEDADIKFIISDHPVTIYNYAAPPDARLCAYPNDPSIALKASQTIFPLTKDFCLILTNLEYAQDPLTSPLDKRTFARNYRNTMIRADAFIRSRKFKNEDVAQINYILKARARRYIAAGRKEWLYPEEQLSSRWPDLRQILLPPKDGLWHFGGEMFARYEDGHVHYQDEFGRSEKERDFLKKAQPTGGLRARDPCGCGSAHRFKDCCREKPAALRPTWSEYSIRERNMTLFNGIVDVLGIENDGDWIKVRRTITDEKIARIYSLYQALWPLETDLLQMLPKPDGSPRSVYTGPIHPETIAHFALGASLYFGELIIEHPFLHPGTVQKKFNPIENPRQYRREFVKTVLFFLTAIPLVEIGIINLVPDPCSFDLHLRDQMHQMAKLRSAGLEIHTGKEERLKRLNEDERKRTLMSSSNETLRRRFLKDSPQLSDAELDKLLEGVERVKENDPLAVLQENTFSDGEENAQLILFKHAPNFEMSMYLAQATGASIVTDSVLRWEEIKRAILGRAQGQGSPLSALAHGIAQSTFLFPQNVRDIATLALNKTLGAYPSLMRDAYKYLLNVAEHEAKPNFEAHLAARFGQAHSRAQSSIKKTGMPALEAQISCAFPAGGIRDNAVNRLLLMSSSERHLPSVPMGFFIEPQTQS